MTRQDDRSKASPSTAVTAKAGTRLRPTRSLLALETRIVFDGAAAHAVVADGHEAAGVTHKAIAGAADTARTAALAPERAPVDTTAKAAAPTTVLFIDASVANPAALLADVKPGVEVVMLDKNSDGVQQIADALKGRHGLDSIQIISEGNDGRVLLGSATLADSNIDQYQAALAGWGTALRAGGDILLFGCDVARTATGDHFVERMAALTGADVAASADATGAAALGGNWVLEKHTGAIEADKAIGDRAVADFDSLLLTGNGTADGTYDFGGRLGAASNGFKALNDKLLVSSSLEQYGTQLYSNDANANSDGSVIVAVFKAEGTTVAKTFTFQDFSMSVTDPGGLHVRYFDQLQVVLKDINGNVIGPTIAMSGSPLTMGTAVTKLSTLLNGGAEWSVANVASVTVTASLYVNGSASMQGGFGTEINFESMKMANISAGAVNTAPTFVGAVTNLSVPQNGGTFDVRSLLHASDSDAGQTLTWSVSNPAGHGTVSLSGATSASGSTDITPGGTFTYTPAAGYAGTDAFTVQVSDGTSTTTRTINVTVTPATPGTPDLAAASDTGASSTDNVTNAASLTFSGTSAAGDATSTVRAFLDVNANGVYDAGTDASATATVNNGAWTVTGLSTTGVAEGVYNVYATTTSAIGAVSSARSTGLAVTIDKTAPGAPGTAITLRPAYDSGISNNDRITSVTNPTVRVSLAGTNAVANNSIELLLGGAALGTPVTKALTSTDIVNGYVDLAVIDGTLGADGAKTFTARVTDVAGNVGAAGGAMTLTLDTTAPGAPTNPILMAAASDSGTSNSDGRTNIDTPLLRITLAGTSAVAGDKVEVLLAGASMTTPAIATLTATNIANGYVDLTVPAGNMGDGVKVLTARVIDVAGNAGAAGGALTFTLDTTRPGTPTNPILMAAASDSGSSNSDGRTSVTNPLIRISLAGTSAVAGDNVELLLGGNSFGTPMIATLSATNVSNGYIDMTIVSGSLGADGVKVLTSRVTDIAGNVGTAGGAFTITLDTAAPGTPANPILLAASSDSGSSNADGRTSVTNPLIRISLAGTNAVAGDTVELLVNSASFGTPMTATLSATNITNGFIDMTIVSGSLGADGTKVLTSRVTDIAGNVGTAGGAFTLTLDTTRPGTPANPILLAASSDSGSSNSDGRTSVTTPLIRITLAGTNAVAGDTVELLVNNASLGTPMLATLSATNINNGYIDMTIASGNLGADGVKVLTSRVTDIAGNVGTAGGAFTLTLDTTAPGTPANPILMAAASDSGSSNADGRTNVTSPLVRISLAGTSAVAGDTVELLLGGGSFGMPMVATLSATNISNGFIDMTIVSGSLGADGVKVLTSRVTDIAGNVGTAGGAFTITLDTAAPGTPTNPILMAAASDSGSSNADGRTSVTNPLIRISLAGTNAAAGDTVELLLNSGSFGTPMLATLSATNISNGFIDMTIASGSLGADGTKVLTSRVTDIAGNVGTAGGALTITLDTTAPGTPANPILLAASSDSGSSNADGRTSVTTPLVRITLAGTNAVAGDTVELLLNSASFGTPMRATLSATNIGNGYIDMTIAGGNLGADGVKVLTSRVTDIAGNVGTAGGAFTLVLDTTAPGTPGSPIIIAPFSDSGSSSSDGITNVTNPLVRINLAGTNAAAGEVAELMLNGGAFGTPMRTTLTLTDISNGYIDMQVGSGSLGLDGVKVLTSRVTDIAGNVGTAGGAFTLTLDTTAPAAPPAPTLDAASDNGASNTDRVTSITTPVINGTAESGSLVTLYDTDGTTVLGTAIATGGAWRITSSTLADGVHNLTVKAQDAAGNVSAASGALQITIAAVPDAPAALALAPESDSGASNTDRLTNVITPVVTGTAPAGTTVTLYDSDGATVLGTATATGGAWRITSSALAAGTHNLTARAVDADGKGSVASAVLTITIDTTAPGTPANPIIMAPFSDSGSSNSDAITSVTNPLVRINLGGTNAAIGDSVELLLNGSAFGTPMRATLNATDIANGYFDMVITSGSLGADGVKVLTARVTDVAGNAGTAGGAFSLTLDTAAPGTPSAPVLSAASDSGASNTDGVTRVTTPTFTGTAEAGSLVTLYDTNGVTVLGTATATGGVWSITSSTLAQGAHSLSVKAVDVAGNTSAASPALALFIDTTAPATPAAPVLAAASDSGASNTDGVTRVTTPVFTGTAEAGSLVTLYDTDGTTVLGTTVASSGVWTITSSTLAPGAHSITVRSTDLAGNTSAASLAAAITIDTAAPGTPAAPVLAAASDSGASNTDGVTRVTTPVFTGTAEAGSLVTLYDTDGTVLGTAVATGGVWSITSSTLASGAHSVTVRAMDSAGNTSSASAARVITIDTTAPGTPAAPVLSAASDSGASNTDGVTRVTTPVFTGTAEAGSLVTLYDTDGTVLGTAVATGGVWSITSSTLAPGAHSVTIRATDTAGNTSAASPALALFIDTTAPATPAAPVLAAASDSGASNTDRVTRVTTPVFTGTAEAGSLVTLYDTDGTQLGTAVATGGVWSITSSTLAAGAHSVTVRSTDTAGNTSAASSALAITIDTTAPGAPAAPTLAAGSDSGALDGITNIATPIVSGTAEAGSFVTLYDTDGATVLGTTVATGGVWSITSATLAPGAHSLTVKATDAAGNTSAASNSLAITIDTTAPGAPAAPALDAASDSGLSNTDGVTRVITPTFTGTAEAGSLVTLYDTDGTTVLGTTTAVGGAWRITSSPLAQGAHSVTVKVVDAAGNTSAASPAVAITVDTTAPATPAAPTLSAASDSGSADTDRITRVTTPAVTGTAEAGSLVRLYDTDGATVLGEAIATGGVWHITSTALADGVHNLSVRTSDTAGNASAASPVLSITIDTAAPAAPTVATTGGATSITTPTVTGTAEAGSTVTLLGTDGVTVLGTTIATGGTWTITSSVLAEGAHALTVKAFDAAGNVSAASAPLAITIDTTAPAAPTVASIGGITSIATPTVTGTAEAGSTITLFDTDGVTVLGTTVATGGTWTITTSVLAEGVHALTVKATDAAGNASAASTAVSFTIDTTAPAAPTVAGTGGITSLTTPTLTGTAEAGSTITLFDTDGVTVLGTTVATGGTWAITTSVLAEGAHALTVKATDAAGNVSAASTAVSFTIDTTAPVAPTVAGTGGITSITTPTLTGTAEAGSTVTLFDTDGVTVLGTTVATGGTWTIISRVLAEGAHALTVKAFDAAGNASAASTPVSLTIDTTAPGAPTVASPGGVTGNARPTLTGTAEPGSRVTLFDTDGVTVLGTTVATGGTWTITSTVLADGAHALTVKSLDAAGNTSAASAAVAITIDTGAPAAPAAPRLATDNGASSTDGITSVRTPTFTGTAEPGSTVTLFDTDGVTVLGTTIATGGAWTITSAALADGVHRVSVRATDAAGNTGAASAALAVTIDTTAPAAPTVANTGGILANRTPTVTGTAESGSTVTLYDSNGATVLGSTVAVNRAWTITSSALAEGSHTLTARTIDAAGNASAASAALAIVVDTTAPLAAGTPQLPDGAASTLDTVPMLTGSAEANSTVIVRSNGTVIGTVQADATGTWRLTAQLSLGTHAITATAVDAAGNTGATSPALNLTILAPPVPVVTAPLPPAPPVAAPLAQAEAIATPPVRDAAQGQVSQSPLAAAIQAAVPQAAASFETAVRLDAAYVAPAPLPTLVLSKPIGDFTVDSGMTMRFVVPADTFVSGDGMAPLLSARLADGSPLPSWIRFDPATGTFTGTPPAGLMLLEIEVVAKDANGNEVRSIFKVQTGAPQASLVGNDLLLALGLQKHASPHGATPPAADAAPGNALSEQLSHEAQRFARAADATLRHLANI
jgi:hypothetical protein